MIVLGESRKGYICEITHTELEKYLGEYYGNLKRLEVGQEVNLGKGYDHKQDVLNIIEQHREFITAHEKIITGINDGITFLCNNASK